MPCSQPAEGYYYKLLTGEVKQWIHFKEALHWKK